MDRPYYRTVFVEWIHVDEYLNQEYQAGWETVSASVDSASSFVLVTLRNARDAQGTGEASA